ncbi:2TM domain-containing protein [Chloroflexota bacterium]
MAKPLSEEEIYEEAKKRVKEKEGFYVHLALYICVNVFIIILWAFATDGGFPWFIFVLFGWGIGLVFHFLEVFVLKGKLSGNAIEKEAEKIRREQK